MTKATNRENLADRYPNLVDFIDSLGFSGKHFLNYLFRDGAFTGMHKQEHRAATLANRLIPVVRDELHAQFAEFKVTQGQRPAPILPYPQLIALINAHPERREEAMNALADLPEFNPDDLEKQTDTFLQNYGYLGMIIGREMSSWFKEELGVSFYQHRRAHSEEIYGNLDERMADAGMMSIDAMIKSSMESPFMTHAGVNDLDTFRQWLELRYRESLSTFMRLELAKRYDDDLYEWALAHKAVFAEVYGNLQQALKPKQVDSPIQPERLH